MNFYFSFCGFCCCNYANYLHNVSSFLLVVVVRADEVLKSSNGKQKFGISNNSMLRIPVSDFCQYYSVFFVSLLLPISILSNECTFFDSPMCFLLNPTNFPFYVPHIQIKKFFFLTLISLLMKIKFTSKLIETKQLKL